MGHPPSFLYRLNISSGERDRCFPFPLGRAIADRGISSSRWQFRPGALRTEVDPARWLWAGGGWHLRSGAGPDGR